MFQKPLKTKFIILCFISSTIFDIIRCQKNIIIRPRNVATAKVFEENDADNEEKGRSFPLTHEPDYWFDMNKLKKDQKLDEIDHICVQGVWLVYQNPDFQANSKKEVGVISGEKTCVNLKEYGQVTSLQPITLLTSRKSDTLAFFPDKDFSGRVYPVTDTLGQEDMPKVPSVTSLITLGQQEWTLILKDGDPVCISPKGTDEFPVCFVSKLIDGEKIKTRNFEKIIKGCQDIGADRTIEIHFCMPYDSGKIQSIAEVAQDIQGGAAIIPTARALGDEAVAAASAALNDDVKLILEEQCPPTDSGPLADELIDKEGQELLQIRLTEHLQSNENYLWPSDPTNIWKLEMLDRTFSIVFATCNEPLVPRPYLELVREIFVYLWDRAYKKDPKVKNVTDGVSEVIWLELNSQLVECNKQVRVDFGKNLVQEALRSFYSIKNPGEVEKALDDILHFRRSEDHIIGTIWLVANHVAATCHHALGFVNNFWTNYIEMFQEMYLDPVEDQWMKPGKLNYAYKFVLGGYGIERQYNKLGICTTTAIQQIDNLDPFNRLIDVVFKK